MAPDFASQIARVGHGKTPIFRITSDSAHISVIALACHAFASLIWRWYSMRRNRLVVVVGWGWSGIVGILSS
jgi:hypothetical protein